MKYSTHLYAKALIEVLSDAQTKGVSEKDEARLADNFIALVRRHGDEMHLKNILEEASRLARGRGGLRRVILESARPLTSSQKNEAAKFLRNDDVVVEKVDPSLIAGIKITVNDERQFDGSLRNKLATLLPF